MTDKTIQIGLQTIALSNLDKVFFPEAGLTKGDLIDDKLIFDLDPPNNDFEPLRAMASSLRAVLQEVGLVPFVMTTGSQGLHVVAPLDRSADFDKVQAFARDLVGVLAGREPERLTIEIRKDKRKDRIFLDYLRNAYAQTSVAPYAVRPKPGAPVATPLDWDELADSSLHAQRYTLRNIFRRLGQKADPWQEIGACARSLDEPRRYLNELAQEVM